MPRNRNAFPLCNSSRRHNHWREKRCGPCLKPLEEGAVMAHTSDTTGLTSPQRQQGRTLTRARASDWFPSLSPAGVSPMYPALSLLFCAALPAAPPGLDNLDFGTGRLTGWQGEGFYVTTGTGRGPG